MKISIIAAIARNGAIGKDGDMIYHIKGDLRRFKQLTLGKPVVMGRLTFESLPGGALPGRRNIVITGNRDYAPAGAETTSSLDEALEMCRDVDEVMIIGGGKVYSQALGRADRLLLTIVDDTPAEADTFFPDIDPDQWEMTDEEAEETDPPTSLKYRYICLSRK